MKKVFALMILTACMAVPSFAGDVVGHGVKVAGKDSAKFATVAGKDSAKAAKVAGKDSAKAATVGAQNAAKAAKKVARFLL